MIFLDTNVISEPFTRAPSEAVMSWLARFDVELALPSIAIAEIAYGIEKAPPDQRSKRLQENLGELRHRFVGRIFSFNEDAAMAFGAIMGAASRHGRGMSTPDGMIAAISHINGGKLATRNTSHFETTGLDLINPWDY